MNAVTSLRWKVRCLKILRSRGRGRLLHTEVEEANEKRLLGWTPSRFCRMLLDREQSRSALPEAPERMVK